ncbi:outer membrane porin GjpA [Mycolicibacter kumamotonensis]|uniref:outer membrane porin GjpA n=1 Tax=Mycolicibacter kumamotonensis TaxID=354243 RepID=UPI0013F4E5F7|nr:outer membrane porin GjpA [Mycolicibacter kumamotonensis]
MHPSALRHRGCRDPRNQPDRNHVSGRTGARDPPPAFHDIALAADGTDLLGPWQDVFNTASQNATTLLNNYFLAPGIAAQQFMANQAGYAQELLDDPTNTNDVVHQMQMNLASVLTGYGLTGASDDTVKMVTQHTLDGLALSGHAFLFNEVPSFLPSNVDPAMVTSILDLLASPASGIIMGALGPAISPWIALMNSINDGDSFSEILAHTAGGFLNGADLDLGSVLPAVNGAGFLPPGLYLTHLDIAFGGLLSTGSVSVGPYQVLGGGGDVMASTPAVGGSIFNSVGLELTGVPVLGTIAVDSQAIGPIGAWEAWGQVIGSLLGSGWAGNGPVDVTAPGAGIQLPLIPDIDDGGAGSGLASELSSWWQDLTALFSN